MTNTSNNPTPVLRDWLKQHGRAWRPVLLWINLLQLLQFGTSLTMYWLLADIVHRLIVTDAMVTMHDLILLLLALLTHLASQAGSQHLSVKLQLSVQQHLSHQLQQQFYQRQYAMIRQQDTRYWQNLFIQQIPALGRYVAHYVPQMRFAAVSLLIILLIAWPINWVVSMVLLLCMPVVPLFMILVGKGAANLHRQHFVALTRLGSLFADRLRAWDMLQVFNALPRQSEHLQRASQLLNQRTLAVVRIAFLSNTVLDFFSTLSVALVAVFVGFSLLGEIHFGPPLTLHSGLFLLLAVPLVFAELKQLGRLYHFKAEATAALATLQSQLEMLNTHNSSSEFCGLQWHEYRIPQPALYAQQLTLQPGDKVWLRGASGAGKSVLLEALMGWRPASHQLNSECAYLTQSPLLSGQTLRDNLCLGEDMSDTQLLHVLRQVELDDWLCQLTNGLDSQFGDHPPLSGGQLQRLALARILLHPRPLVLLDEPTAHLTENLHVSLCALLEYHLRDKTVIWASHKPLNQAWFNRCWDIQHGEIEEQICQP